jgi:tRNA nucleotidyltransferase (CCA-adding enzyme)
MGVKKILNDVLSEISLSESEVSLLKASASEAVKKISSGKVKAFVGGSLAKGTLIRKEGSQDIDVFVVFDNEKNTEKLGAILKKAKLPGKLKVVHGSRDYYQAVSKDTILEIIPVVKNVRPADAENVTDVSLSHVKYVGGKIKKNSALADEIKLAKTFCYANRCYGAEGYIKGFSGYGLEILIIHYGSFVKMLKGLLKRPRTLDPEKAFRGEREVMSELNASKLQSPVIIVDPTYKYRNVLAGLGSETFEKFLKVAYGFLKSSSANFFKKEDIDVGGIRKLASKKKARFIELDLKTDRQEGDIAGTKMKKFFDFICNEFHRKQQEVIGKEFDYSGKGKKAKGYIVVREKKIIDVRGPAVRMVDAVKGFKKANKGAKIFKKKGFLWRREKVSLKKIFSSFKKVGKEMGAGLN